MAKLLFLAMLAGALANGLAAKPEPPLLIDSQPGSGPLDAQG